MRLSALNPRRLAWLWCRVTTHAYLTWTPPDPKPGRFVAIPVPGLRSAYRRACRRSSIPVYLLAFVYCARCGYVDESLTHRVSKRE
jgi:hypothetical protein